MQDPSRRIRHLKTVLICLVFGVAGIVLMALSRVLEGRADLDWVSVIPLSELGAILFGAGILGVGLDAYLARENQEIAERQLRRVLADHAPAIRDAVIDGFAFKREDLRRVATPETLDQIIRNSLALRLGDEGFATELYDDIRDQAIRSSERWHDVKVDIRLSMDNRAPAGSTQSYVATVRWEYSVVPAHQTRRFVVVSDRDEYRDLAQESAATSAWYIRPKGGIEVGDRKAFELVQFTVDGEDRPIRRSTRKGGQTYSASLGPEVIGAGEPVRISYTYRTLVSRNGHLLHVDVEQPTRGISVELDYSATDIDYVKVVDFIASNRRSRLSESPEAVPGRSIGVDFDGWLMPRSGVAFVWVLSGAGSGARS